MERSRLLNAHRAMNHLLKDLALGMDKDRLNQEIISLSEQMFGQRKASILRLAENKLYIECSPSLPDFYNQAINGIDIGADVGSCGAAAFHKQLIVVSDIDRHPNWQVFLKLTQPANLHACWSVPIISSQNIVLGTFAIYSDTPSDPRPYELEILETLASVYAVAMEKFQLEKQLRFHASRDPLTLCLNRRALLQEVEQALLCPVDTQTVVGCFFADVDDFKAINDHYGHDVGDAVLSQVANRFTQQLGSLSLVGRYGGDEFVAFERFESTADFELFYHQLRQSLCDIVLDDGSLVSVSLGSSIAEQGHRLKTDKLIRTADQAMYRLKAAKRNKHDRDQHHIRLTK